MSIPLRHRVQLVIFIGVFAWSVVEPLDAYIWVLEVFPAVIGLGLVLATYNKFRLTDLAYIMILLHCIILMIGGHYTYAEVPLFDWLQQQFDLARNYYDRVGHIAQGFFPAIIAREILLRLTPLEPGGWLFFIVTSICLAISAFYEFFEWWVALLTGEAADVFLATQGDVWDTQWDMFLAFCGAMAAQLIFTRLHDGQLQILSREQRQA